LAPKDHFIGVGIQAHRALNREFFKLYQEAHSLKVGAFTLKLDIFHAYLGLKKKYSQRNNLPLFLLRASTNFQF
jgi:hypothetical protein